MVDRLAKFPLRHKVPWAGRKRSEPRLPTLNCKNEMSKIAQSTTLIKLCNAKRYQSISQKLRAQGKDHFNLAMSKPLRAPFQKSLKLSCFQSFRSRRPQPDVLQRGLSITPWNSRSRVRSFSNTRTSGFAAVSNVELLCLDPSSMYGGSFGNHFAKAKRIGLSHGGPALLVKWRSSSELQMIPCAKAFHSKTSEIFYRSSNPGRFLPLGAKVAEREPPNPGTIRFLVLLVLLLLPQPWEVRVFKPISNFIVFG